MDSLRNLASSTVAAAPSPATAGLTLTLASGEGARFPSSGSFDVLIRPAATEPTLANSELCRASRLGDVLTLTRGQGGTSARAVVVTDVVAQVVTAELLAQIEADAAALVAAEAAARTSADALLAPLASPHFTGTPTLNGSPLGSGSSGAVDGGSASSTYGGTTAIDGGTA